MNWVENGESTARFLCSTEKPNIFLIGDSIRKGYCETVKNELSDTAEVFYVKDNCRSTQYVIFNLKKWAGLFDDPKRVDLVQFNCGHWDVAHWNGHALPLTSEGEYERNLGIIIDLLHKFFPNARLVFATTTPMNPSGKMGVNVRTDADIDRYNAIAVRLMEAREIPVNDLNAFVRPLTSEAFADYCHLTEEGFALLGRYVAERLRHYF